MAISDAMARRLVKDMVSDLRMARKLELLSVESREENDWKEERRLQDAARAWITRMQTKLDAVEILVGGDEGRDLKWMLEDEVYTEVHGNQWHAEAFCTTSAFGLVARYSETGADQWHWLAESLKQHNPLRLSA